MIRMRDGSVYAQLSPPDMTLPIVAAVADGRQALVDVVRPLSFKGLTLTFEDWDRERFPLLQLAYEVLGKKAGYPIAYNAADEVAVQAFVDGQIGYLDIARVVGSTLDADWSAVADSYEAIMEVDGAARRLASSLL